MTQALDQEDSSLFFAFPSQRIYFSKDFFKENDLIWLLSSPENFYKCKIHPYTMFLIIRQGLFLVHLIPPYLSFQEQWHVANTI